MTRVKFCGLTRRCDIEAASELKPDYIGFIFASGSSRYIDPRKASELRKQLSFDISAVGVFVNEDIFAVADLLNSGTIDIAQLHGSENENYIQKLRTLTEKPIIKAFRINSSTDIESAKSCCADYVLLDSGSGGTGAVFDWELVKELNRPYFLAGGLTVDNVGLAIKTLNPFAVDVSSGIETNGLKDRDKMKKFIDAVKNI